VQVEDIFYVGTTNANGLVNVNSASEEVLQCIPGIGVENASSLIARRRSNPANTHSLAWVAEVLDSDAQTQCGPYITGRSHQFAVDIVALGHYARGFRRTRFIVDTTGGNPRLISRRDLTSLGWALGRDLRNSLILAQKSR
jgi:hypothetical protein